MTQISPSIPLPPGENLATQVFQTPWEAYVFALAVQLSEQGIFAWPELTRTLAMELRGGNNKDHGTHYYYWLTALEKLLTQHGLISQEALQRRMAVWREAFLRTPHGKPVEL